jgi:uncharacterized protein (TIGR02246 family)
MPASFLRWGLQSLWPKSLVLLSVVAGLVPALSTAAPPKSAAAPAQTDAIRASADDFTAAFNKGDAKAVAALWTPDGSETDEQGTTFKGRQAIEAEYAKLFKARPDARIQIEVHSVEFPASNVAVEDGVATVTTGGAPPSSSRYTVVHVIQDGKWLMSNVHESPDDVKSGAETLQSLGWLIGKWQAKMGDVVADSDISWLANRSFIRRDYTVRKGDATTGSGIQIIGWDPQQGQIRSWSFDSTGGYGTGLWSQTPDGWQIDHIGTFPDSTPSSSRDFVIRVPGEDNVLGFRSTHRLAGASVLPDTAEIVFDRVKEKP